jgi:uncharacterized membrane protein YgcG
LDFLSTEKSNGKGNIFVPLLELWKRPVAVSLRVADGGTMVSRVLWKLTLSVVLDSDRHVPVFACLFLLRTANLTFQLKESYVKKIYVGNFSFSMTESELRSLFEPYGTIESATVATDRDTGRSRGFGFVSMSNDDEAEKAMAALNGKDSGGRALTVNEARPQAARGGFRDGGGGGGGGRGGDRNSRPRREPRW